MKPPAKESIIAAQTLFAVRCSELADRVSDGKIGFLDAIDLAHSAAVWAGLDHAIGDDGVQLIMAAAFGAVGEDRRGRAVLPPDSA